MNLKSACFKCFQLGVLTLLVMGCGAPRAIENSTIPLPGVPKMGRLDHLRETDGFIRVEAESFHSSHVNESAFQYMIVRDDALSRGASKNSYVAVSLNPNKVQNVDLAPPLHPGGSKGGFLLYKINFSTAGQYYVWIRSSSNIHDLKRVNIGVDGYWPESSAKIAYPEANDGWAWTTIRQIQDQNDDMEQRVKLNILEPGNHSIMFSIADADFNFDEWVMTLDKKYQP